ncbi:MAG: hypothetical protein ACRC8W_18670 [Plesiomonas shigelloides]
MTLLELLVQELPKRGGWPQWAAAAVQGDWKGGLGVSFAGENYHLRHDGKKWTSSGGGSWGEGTDSNDFAASSLASDHATRIVTREEYERAAAIKASEDMVKAAIRQLTDAVTMKSDEVNDTGYSGKSRIVKVDVTIKPSVKPMGMKIMFPIEMYSAIGEPAIIEPSVDGGFSAGYTTTRGLKQGEAVRATDIAPLTPLQRIEQLRKARDEAVRAYNDAFVTGEWELCKLKMGDEVMFRDDDNPSTLIKTKVESGIDGVICYEWVFQHNSNGERKRIVSPINSASYYFVKL